MLQYMHELPVYMCLWSSIYLMGLGHARTKMQLQLRRTGKRDLFMIGIGLSHGAIPITYARISKYFSSFIIYFIKKLKLKNQIYT
jgi:hypothetical protein